MVDIPVPDRSIRHVEWTMPPRQAFVVASRWAPHQQVGDLGGIAEGLSATVELIQGRPDHARRWRAFFAALKGPINTFLLDPANDKQAFLPCDVAVSGAGQIGDVLKCAGAIHDVQVVRAGDMVSIGGRFHTVLADARSTASGLVTLRLEPPVQKAPSNGMPVLIRRPMVRMRLPRALGGWSQSPGNLELPFSFEAVEVLS